MKSMFNIMEKKWIFFGIAIVLLLTGLVSFFIQGLNLDIEFAGGVLVTYEVNEQFDQAEAEEIVRGVLGDLPFGIQRVGGTAMTIRFPYSEGVNTSEMARQLETAITARFGDVTVLNQDYISPDIGRELAMRTLWMVLIAALVMLVYISIRFEFVTACVLVLSLIYNLGVMMTIYTLFQIPVNITFIAAILTVLAYTSNDTIVIFDRIRENMRNAKKETYSSVANRSIWQSLTRSINTAVTTLFILCALIILGVPSIREFAFPIVVGIIIGAFSSIFIAAPLWATWKDAGVKGKA
ncbi:MAG: protein translocase subunit SecF [Oscillospiraceae bacterium]|nr:protein translocase subunit SecF [Oscillospiraceae bacterium]